MRRGRGSSGGSVRERGAVYLFVLITAMIVTVLGVGGIYAAMAERAGRRSLEDAVQSRRSALSAIEVAITKAKNTSAFRRGSVSTPVSAGTLGTSAYSVSASDPTDADLVDSIKEPIRFTATASYGTARTKLAVSLTPRMTMPTCFDAPLSVSGTAAFNGGSVLSDTAIFSNTSVTASAATVYSDVASAGGISGTTYSGANTPAQSARVFPDATTIFAQYAADGTAISYASTGGQLQQILLGATSNPFGTVNPSGIYVIDCKGSPMRIQDMRVHGTLVLLNAGAGSRISGSVQMDPALAGYPCLLVQGPMQFDGNAGGLTESGVARNLNPAGDPYLGRTDAAIDDTYPALFSGVVYVSGDVTVTRYFTVEGVAIIGGRLTSTSGNIILRYKKPDIPPPGFQTGSPFAIDHSSWAQVVD